MTKIYLALILVLMLTLGCFREQRVAQRSSGITINIDTIPRVDSLSLSKLFLKFKIIPLEILVDNFTSDLIRVKIHNNFIYVADLSIQKSIDVYSIDGKFITRIKKLGRGPGEYLLPTDFDIDENGDVLILDWSKPIINRYDHKTGNFKKSFTTPENRRFSSFAWFKGEIIFFQPTPLSLDDEQYCLYIVDTLGRIKTKLLPTFDYSKGYSGSTSEVMGNFFKYANELFIFSSLSETIYRYYKGKLTQHITLSSTKYQLTSEDIHKASTNSYERIRYKELEKLKGVERFICNEKNAYIFYNIGIQNNIVISYNLLNNNVISGNLPSIKNDLTVTRNLHFQGLWDNKIITFTTPKTTDFILTNLRSGKIKLDPEDRESLISNIERIKTIGGGIPHHLIILYDIQCCPR